MILDQLSAVRKEWLQVRIGGVDPVAVQLLGARDIAIEIERSEIPVRILEDHVPEIIQPDRERLRSSPRAPAQFAARLQPGIDRLLRARIDRRTVDLTRRFDLLRQSGSRGPSPPLHSSTFGSNLQRVGSSSTPSLTPSSASQAASTAL